MKEGDRVRLLDERRPMNGLSIKTGAEGTVVDPYYSEHNATVKFDGVVFKSSRPWYICRRDQLEILEPESPLDVMDLAEQALTAMAEGKETLTLSIAKATTRKSISLCGRESPRSVKIVSRKAAETLAEFPCLKVLLWLQSNELIKLSLNPETNEFLLEKP